MWLTPSIMHCALPNWAGLRFRHKPRLSSNNSPGYLVGELADYLQENGMTHAWGSAYQPRPQSKIERWHQSMKNQILLNNYYLPSELHEHLQTIYQLLKPLALS